MNESTKPFILEFIIKKSDKKNRIKIKIQIKKVYKSLSNDIFKFKSPINDDTIYFRDDFLFYYCIFLLVKLDYLKDFYVEFFVSYAFSGIDYCFMSIISINSGFFQDIPSFKIETYYLNIFYYYSTSDIVILQCINIIFS